MLYNCKYCNYETDNIYEYLRHMEQKRETLRNDFRKKIDSFDDNENKRINNRIEILKYLYELTTQKKIVFKYSMTRIAHIIWVLDSETKTELYSWYFSYGLGWMHTAVFEFWKNKCAQCKISEKSAYKKYGRGLELHHTTPISFYEQNSETSKSPLEMFEPRCHGCHDRGLQ